MRLGVMSKLVGRDQARVDELLQDVEMDQVCVSDLIRSCCIVPSHLAAWHEDVESNSC
jgi:hypothetical protein